MTKYFVVQYIWRANMYYTTVVDDSWGDTKEREYMVRKKRIDKYILKIKPNLLKKSI